MEPNDVNKPDARAIGDAVFAVGGVVDSGRHSSHPTPLPCVLPAPTIPCLPQRSVDPPGPQGIVSVS